MSIRVSGSTLACVFSVVLAASAQKLSPLDYTQWRGPQRDGSASAFTEPAAWPETLTERWKVEIGLGYATPLVVGNRIYVFSRRGDNEVMSALDADSGKTVWERGYPVAFTMNKGASRHGQGPKSTPAYADGKLFSIGMTGVITAHDAGSGRELWRKPGSDLLPMFTTHAFSPVVDRGVVIFHPGGHDKGAITAFDVNTGATKWTWDGGGPVAGITIARRDGKWTAEEAWTNADQPYRLSNPVLLGQTLFGLSTRNSG